MLYEFEVPCVTLRDETEWRETVDTGWNVIVGAEYEKIIRHVQALTTPEKHPQYPISNFPG